MKKTFILIISLFMVFVLGCSGGAVKPGGEATAAPPSVTTPANTNITPSPAPSAGPEPTLEPGGVRYCSEPEEYLKLEAFLRDLGFDDDTQLELYPSRLQNGLWRASFYDKPVKRAQVLLCLTSDMEVWLEPVPGGAENRLGRNVIYVKFVSLNPEYQLGFDTAVPRYLVDKEATKMAYTDVAVILLNGFGITYYSYPILSPRLPGALNNYVKYDYNRKIEGEDEKYEAHAMYEIFYCEDEIFWIEEIGVLDGNGIGVKGKDWEYKG